MRALCILATLFISTIVSAAEPDFQARALLHLQRGSFAAWGALPDATAENRKVLGVGGLLLKHVDKKAGVVKWTEIMAGGFMDETWFEPVVNVRAFRSTPKADTYVEVLQNFRIKRTVVVASMLVPLAPHFAYGGDGELVLEDGKKPIGLIGPRANVPFSCVLEKCVLGMTVFANLTGGDNAARVYVLLNF